MTNLYKTFRQIFIDDTLYEKEYLTDEEIQKLKEDGKNMDTEGYAYDYRNNRYYKKKLVELSDPELSQLLSIKSIELLKSIDKKLFTIKSLLVLLVILSVLSIAGFIIVVNNIGIF